MTEDLHLPPPVETLLRAVTGGAGSDTADDERAMPFVRGLALGALVGAAIAGSTIWQRRISRRGAAAGEARGTDLGRVVEGRATLVADGPVERA
jgi:hypothetical protein